MTISALAMSRDGSEIMVAWSRATVFAAIVNNLPKAFDPETGAVIWSGGPGSLIDLTRTNGICVDSTGAVIVMGSLVSGFKVQKISADGTTSVWIFDGSALVGPEFMAIDSSDNIYVASTANHTYPDNSTVPEVFLYKINSSGALVGTLNYFPLGAPEPDSGMGDFSFELDAFCATPAGAAVVGGATTGLYPFPPHGSVRGAVAAGFGAAWQTNLAAIENSNTIASTIFSIVAGADGNTYAGATNDDSVNGETLSLIKVTPSGSVTVIHGYGFQDSGGPVDIDQAGNLYVSYEAGSTFHLQKISSSGSVAWDNSVGSGNGSGFGLAASDGFIYQDNVHGARKLSSADGTTVLWTNTALALSTDSVTAWARPQY